MKLINGAILWYKQEDKLYPTTQIKEIFDMRFPYKKTCLSLIAGTVLLPASAMSGIAPHDTCPSEGLVTHNNTSYEIFARVPLQDEQGTCRTVYVSAQRDKTFIQDTRRDGVVIQNLALGPFPFSVSSTDSDKGTKDFWKLVGSSSDKTAQLDLTFVAPNRPNENVATIHLNNALDVTGIKTNNL